MLKDRNIRAGFKSYRFKAFRLMKGISLQLRHYTSLSEVNKHYLFEYVQHRARVAIEVIANCSRNYQVFFSQSQVLTVSFIRSNFPVMPLDGRILKIFVQNRKLLSTEHYN